MKTIEQAPIRSLPTFMIIGAGKSGTTSLYEYLLQHPQIHMSPVKETNFFALRGQKVEQEDTSEDQMYHYPWSVTSDEAYIDLFKEGASKNARGEVSPMYLYHPEAPGRIHELLPEVKLIAILRQPAERLYSRYMHLWGEDRAPSNDLNAIFDKDSVWWKRDDLVREGFYGTYLQRYYDLFPSARIKVYLFEDLRKRPEELIKDLYHFCGVDDQFQPDLEASFNVSGKPKNKVLDVLIGKDSWVKSALDKTMPGLSKKVKDNLWVKNTINKWRKKNTTKLPFDKELKKRITREIYLEDIERLEAIIDRDLSSWK